MHAGIGVFSFPMIVFQIYWMNVGGGPLRIVVQTLDYVCFKRLCMVLLPYHYHNVLFTRHLTSHPLALRQTHTDADYYKYSFFPLAIFEWKRLPPSIALLPNIDSFRLAVSSLSHSKP